MSRRRASACETAQRRQDRADRHRTTASSSSSRRRSWQRWGSTRRQHRPGSWQTQNAVVAGRRRAFRDARRALARHRRVRLGGAVSRHARGGGRAQHPHGRHRPRNARLSSIRRSRRCTPRPAGDRPGGVDDPDGDVLASWATDLDREMARLRADLPIGIEFARCRTSRASSRQAVGDFMRVFLGEALGIVLAGELPQPGPAHRPGGGHDHPLGAGGDLPRHALLRHRPAPHLHRGADHRAGPAGGRRHDRGRDDVAQDRAGPRTSFAAATFAWRSTAFPMLTGTLITAAGFLPIAPPSRPPASTPSRIFAVVTLALLISWVAAVASRPSSAT
jgi:hypothetical protein